MDAGLKRELEAKVYAGERLNREDGIALYESDDLAWLGRLAHFKRTEMNGDRVLFNDNLDLNLDSEKIDEAVSKAKETDGGPILDELMAARLESPAMATMLYGHIEEPSHRVDHVVRLRELQDETGGFETFILLRPTMAVAPIESLKTFAVSRLLFDNAPHVTCSLVTHGSSIAQLTLNFGADDLAGSSGDAAAMHRGDLLNLIWDAGFRPVERSERFEVVREYDAAPSLADRRSEPQQVWA
jgi:aminodeoxyfutalosine synthase